MLKNGDHESKTDEELVALTLENQGYFLYLIKRYEKKLLNYIIRISGVSKEEAEDILQETFIKIYQNLNDFDTSLKFSSWAYRIAHNQTISNHRKNKARPQNIFLDPENDFLENLASDLDLKQEIDLDFLKKNINEILARIDEKYREILVLKFLEQKSYKEISDILKKPMGTVATLINRAKEQFREVAEKVNIQLR
ncbi:sigma-70 family RNA polymerase sigma factor [Patescibacteria group bacterium]|nr:sigma-70 family RNA polymerase sigma factor [Patescibacteria group bacterium]MBU4512720.1 sigma-70 family RNA polymerase sigma factor [Patescibacteria group bacterium]MCG2693657.1 sigma-70 family RNA polymerase sigma factor [Candidatus Parcubacteria bacterium]